MMNRDQIAGFGLSEVLISLFISSVIMLTLSQLYISNKRQYQIAHHILNASLEIQWVGDMLSDSIRKAGFTPCRSIDDLSTLDRRNEKSKIKAITIAQGAKGAIQLSRMSESFISRGAIQNSYEIWIPKTRHLNFKRPIVISDCQHAEVHWIDHTQSLKQGVVLFLKKPIFFSYQSKIYLGEWLEEHWRIKTNSNGVNALYYQMAQSEELTDLIHSMQVQSIVVNNKKKLNIILGLDEDKTYQFIVAARNS